MRHDVAIAASKRIIAVHSKSFALASRLLPRPERDRAVVVYAWCRHADDAVDTAAIGRARVGLETLRRQLNAVYAPGLLESDPILAGFQHVARTCAIPRIYPEELLAGLAMDVEGTRYATLAELLVYCYRVAGTVGLMMCHVMGVRDESATSHAVHLGVAMQLTNICRDVAEDWHRGRLYLPADALERHGCGWLPATLGGPFPPEACRPVAAVTAELLDTAERYYRSGDAGIPALSWRCGLAIRTAGRVYAAIGNRIRARGCDPLAGRAWVARGAKLVLASRAVAGSLQDLPRLSRRGAAQPVAAPCRVVRAVDALPVHCECENKEQL